MADKKQVTIKISKFLHEEAKPYVGDPPKPYTSYRNLVDDAVRPLLKDLKKNSKKEAKKN